MPLHITLHIDKSLRARFEHALQSQGKTIEIWLLEQIGSGLRNVDHTGVLSPCQRHCLSIAHKLSIATRKICVKGRPKDLSESDPFIRTFLVARMVL